MQTFISLLLAISLPFAMGYFFKILLLDAIASFYKGKVHGSITITAQLLFTFASMLALPFPMPQIQLSNGDNIIVIQGVSHIGKGSFYEQIHDEANRYRDNGYTIIHEGIGLKINDKTQVLCNKSDFSSNGIYQSQPECLGNILSYDKSYEPSTEKVKSLIDAQNFNGNTHSDSKDGLITTLASKARVVADNALSQRFANQTEENNSSVLTMTLAKSFFFADAISTFFIDEEPSTDDIKASSSDDIVIDYRNKMLVNGLLELKKDAYVIYGMKHIPGAYFYLKTADDRWKITNIKFVNATPLI